MKMRHGLTGGAAAFALLLAGCNGDEGNKVAGPPGGEKIAPVAPPAGTDWSQVVEETRDGGFRMGNPNAPVRLLEYGSFGCPHCAEFEGEAVRPLEDQYIKSGRVSWEFRSFLLFPSDPAVTLLARCNGPQPFFLLKEQLYATQMEWERKMQGAMDQLQQLPPKQRLKPMIQAAGLDEFFRQRGMPEAKIDACLNDSAALERAVAVSQRGTEDFAVTGTPSFYINGIKIEGGRWQEIEPQLKKALGE
jgi:protein-disulfide isomerase